MKILFIGDIVGQPGRQAVSHILPGLKQKYSPVFVVANAENSAGGIGVTRDTARDLLQAGVDVMTLGNHAWAKKDVYSYIDSEPNILRPANYPDGAPGRGWAIYPTETGVSVGVVNLCGRVFMDSLENPFTVADKIIETLSRDTDVILVDFHGEATSEKCAFGWYMDGRVSAVVGTHTHVQTADERILPGGTAYITDVGMTGPSDSVIGVRKELIITKFLTQMPNKFEVADGDAVLSAVVIDFNPGTGKAVDINRLQISYSQNRVLVR
ncbi:MAG: TIGR00282 family metallophosphoesterase [Armatimonadota bacterium]